jgi:predicted lipid-binding transport protein (Tim44 family)
MNKTWKWILIGLGVFILAFCVGLPLFLGLGASLAGNGGMPMMRQPFGGYPMMGGRGFGIFGGFGLLRLLFPLFGLGLVVLVIAGIVLLLRRPQKPAVAASAAAMVVTPAASVVPVPTADFTPSEPIPPAAGPAVVVETTPCPHCGAPVQSGWVACPHCGEKLV